MPRRNERRGKAQRPRKGEIVRPKLSQIAKPLASTAKNCKLNPGKMRYKNERLAHEAARMQHLLHGHSMRAYRCTSCQGWHLSSMPASAIFRPGTRVRMHGTRNYGEVVRTEAKVVTVKWDLGELAGRQSRHGASKLRRADLG